MKNIHLSVLILLLLLHPCTLLFTDTFYISYTDQEKFKLTIKGNYKIYHNNVYKGLKVKDVKGLLSISELDSSRTRVSGNVYHYSKTIRGNNLIGHTVDAFESCNFILDHTGAISDSSNPIFPPIQGIPYFPEREIKPGDVYEVYGTAGVSLYNSDRIEILKTISIIQYNGKKQFLDRELDYFTIQYGYSDIVTKGVLAKARGRHTIELYFDNYTGKPVFMRDQFVEEFTLVDGDTIKHDGFYLYFYKLIYPMNKKKVIDDMEEIIREKIKEEYFADLEFKQKDDGIAITLNDLNFKPDSPQLLSTEYSKLDAIAEALNKIPERSFMIIGHTAKYGSEEAQKKLSLERARSVGAYLIKKGLPAERIFYAGKGASEPIAPNDTPENMARNRRVEIIILED